MHHVLLVSRTASSVTFVLRDPRDVTPAWLMSILRREGVLGTNEVRLVRARRNPAFNSRTWHLDLTYDDARPGPALLLKANLPEAWARKGGQREVALYDLTRTLPEHPDVLVRAFDTAFDAATTDSHVLLLDVSSTHDVALAREAQLTPGRNVPSPRVLDACVTSLARLHAFWWQHPLLGGEVVQLASWCEDDAAIAREVERRRRAFEALQRHEPDALEPRLVRLYERVFADLERVLSAHLPPRMAARRHLTLSHGDAYPANVFVPKAGVHAPTYWIDWQSYEAWLGAQDLVTLCATHWTRAQRAEGNREREALHRYHDALLAHGVAGYAWEDFTADYRLALLCWLLVPLQDRLDGADRSYWRTKMTCLADACEDWDVGALLSS